MKVMVVGAGGQVGRALMSCAPLNVSLRTYTRRELDITDEGAVVSRVQQIGPDVIINAAAYTNVDQAEREADRARQINADGPGRLALAAQAARARLIHISTDFVFDGAASEPYKPESATSPLNVYGLSKRDGEQAVLRALPKQSVVLRTAWVYAAAGRNFVHAMLQAMPNTGSVRVVADQVGTPTAALSVAEMVWRIVAAPELTGIHHWTDAGVASWYDFAVGIAEEGAAIGLLPHGVTVIPITTDEYPTAARRPRFSVLDKTSLASLGVNPVHWRTRLRDVLGEIKHA